MELLQIIKYFALLYSGIFFILFAGSRLAVASMLNITNTSIDYDGISLSTTPELLELKPWKDTTHKDMIFWGEIYDFLSNCSEKLITTIPHTVSTFSALVLLWVAYEYIKT